MKNVKINKKTENNWIDGLTMTNHFKKRYNNRVLGKSTESLSKIEIFNDMKLRLSLREKMALELFKNSKMVKFPMRDYEMIISKKILITIYN
tara:strand:+ start:199 stop:474 length:276 start_codon:yes stop_codon:yes gene_type:complete